MSSHNYMVMSATTLTGKNLNQHRCFSTNAIDIPTIELARHEAKRRNRIERKAGHTNVEWYAIQMLPDFTTLPNKHWTPTE